eukprot:2026271-Prymnesium_polylepis.1
MTGAIVVSQPLPPPPPPSPPCLPPHPPLPPFSPGMFFDFSTNSTPGWSTVGGTHSFDRHWGGTSTLGTGPSTGVDGSGFYYHADTSNLPDGNPYTL